MSAERRGHDVEQIQVQLRRLLAAQTLELHQSSRRAGLSLHYAEALVLHLLRLHGSLTPGELRDRAGIASSGTLTGAIDRLERAGYTRREPCVEDRRKVFITLTPQGNSSPGDRWVERIRDLSPDDCGVVARFLDELLDEGR